MNRYVPLCQRWYKRPGYESVHLLPYSTKVKSEWSCTSILWFGPHFWTDPTLPILPGPRPFSLLVSQATRYVCEPVKSHTQPHNSQSWYLFCHFSSILSFVIAVVSFQECFSLKLVMAVLFPGYRHVSRNPLDLRTLAISGELCKSRKFYICKPNTLISLRSKYFPKHFVQQL